ncbi:hypothetical protein L7E55_09265 [Pelotomaculum isophthalicicum JI]|uniref:DUF2325 domain-containing protein n=1 Tax=Pelotomaculum isophthalicicum JI TaxID=947010 RepID=A0A9X4JU65_9FIRM|nr:hypothetical protein [Pelotomaculum isophthalicicum]MDF9408545.1 hypothetical protein [Pelotomaculum isophthalicicum JI]
MDVIGKAVVDLVPFFIEAFGLKKEIYHDIDVLYQDKRAAYFRLASASKYYRHPVVREGTTQQEEYAKKTLGILMYLRKHSDSEVWDQFFGIMKKGWPHVFEYIDNNDVISFESFFADRTECLGNSGSVNAETAVLLCMANLWGKEVEADSLFESVCRVLHGRLMVRERNNPGVFCHKNMEMALLKNVRELMRQIHKKYGEINTLDSVFRLADEELAEHVFFYERLCDAEGMNISRIFDDIAISAADIEEILGAYLSGFHHESTSEAAKYLVSGLLFRGLLKAYKTAKEHYLHSSKDGTYIDAEFYEKTVEAAIGEREHYKAQAEQFRRQVVELRENLDNMYSKKMAEMGKKIKELENQMLVEKQKEKELIALRSLMFSLNNVDAPEVPDLQEESVMDVIKVKVAVAGGFERWQRKMKERYPHFIFITSENFDTRLLDGVGHVFIFARHIGHKLYYRVINEAKKRDMPVSYVSKVNEELAVKEMKNALAGQKVS